MDIAKKMLECRFCGGEMVGKIEDEGKKTLKIFSCPKEACEKKKNKWLGYG